MMERAESGPWGCGLASAENCESYCSLLRRGYLRRDPPIASATAVRLTAIRAQTERNRKDMSARCAENHCAWARTWWLRGLIRPVPAPCATKGTDRGEKRLSSGRVQAIFVSGGMPPRECRVRCIARKEKSSDIPACILGTRDHQFPSA